MSRQTKSNPPSAPACVRCAIYTRKSTEEGLDQEFNTLDAQRESAEAYIASQRHEGWIALPDLYDDGGFTGGNMDRPALKRLMRDVEDGKVDCIVVYKVDRLSRSLLDFSRIMEALEKNNAKFVSVTQQFNTTHSMGRLTLNILLSFAQFEREIIAERTRDKMSAARKKGRWVGGSPVLGYDVDPAGGRILVNEVEAEQVRDIFACYLEHQGLVRTAQELNRRGWTTKCWTSKRSKKHGGLAFNKTNLFKLLTNIIYIGKVNYKGEIYEGQQQALVSEDIWNRVQTLLKQNGTEGGARVRNKYGALLKGLLVCESCNAAMIHAYTSRGNRRYRYYVCSHAQKFGWETCPTRSVPAHDIEKFVVEQIHRIGTDDALVAEAVTKARAENEERLRVLQREQETLRRELHGLSGQERELVKTMADVGEMSGTETRQLADVQERMEHIRRRSTELREEVVTVSGELVTEREMAAALSLFSPVWDQLTPREQCRVMSLVVERVGYDGEAGSVALTFRPNGIHALAQEHTVNMEESRDERNNS